MEKHRDGSAQVALDRRKPGWLQGNRGGSEVSQPGSGENGARRAWIGPPRKKSGCLRPRRFGAPERRLASPGTRLHPLRTSHALKTAARLPKNHVDSGDSGSSQRKIVLSTERSLRLRLHPSDLERRRHGMAGARPAWREAPCRHGSHRDLTRRRHRLSGVILVSP